MQFKKMVAAFLILVVLLVGGCTSSDSNQDISPANGDNEGEVHLEKRDGTFTIGVSTDALSNEHGRQLFDKTKEYIEAAGHKAVMANAMGQAVEQMRDIENLLESQVDVLIIQNGDTDGLASVIRKAADQGVPVVSVETGDVDGVSVSIAPNDFVIGATIASYLSGQIGNAGKVATFYHNNHPAIRTRGLMIEAVLKENRLLENVGHHNTIFPGTTEDAYNAMESILIAHPDIKAVFCSQDLEAIGVARALQAAGRNDVLTVGVDGEVDALNIIKDGGPIIATAVFDVDKEAQLSVDAAIKLAKGEAPESRVIFLPFTLVTRENVDQFIE